MKRKMIVILTKLFVMVPMVALADVAPPGGNPVTGCWYLSTDINSVVGAVLVGVSVGIVLRTRRP